MSTSSSSSDMLAPGEFRNGKKRTSPSFPLHPSQLQVPHHAGGMVMSSAFMAATAQAQAQAGGYQVEASSGVGTGAMELGQLLAASGARLGSIEDRGEESSVPTNHSGLSSMKGSLNSNSVQRAGAAGMSPRRKQPQGLLHAALQENNPLPLYDGIRGHTSDVGSQVASSQAPAASNHLHQHPINHHQQMPQPQSANSTMATIANMKGRGGLLTNPSEPAANSGLDNIEGNLIVRKGDVFHIPKKNMHTHPPSPSCTSSPSTMDGHSSDGGRQRDNYPGVNSNDTRRKSRVDVSSNHDSPHGGQNRNSDNGGIAEYTVMGLLGQGTFAQVFHCIEHETGQSMAVKIVKNKPAYTRQAAVEIDVFRTLSSSDDITVDGDVESTSATGGGCGIAMGVSVGSSVPSSSFIPPSSSSKHRRHFNAVNSTSSTTTGSSSTPHDSSTWNGDAIIHLLSYFMHNSHLCLVFEMLGPNLYELLKKRQFRGLPIGAVRTLVRQATEGIKVLGRKNVVHCDLKPENILMVGEDAMEAILSENNTIGSGEEGSTGSMKPPDPNTPSSVSRDEEQWIKLIDFGSACFEGQTTHTYIQSRFYRSPEVLIGLPYDSAIDMWSLGCVAAELFLGLPILPGVHEHDQLGRILEMIGPLPAWMTEQGNKSSKFFKKVSPKVGAAAAHVMKSSGRPDSTLDHNSWEFKSRQEYINDLSKDEKQSKGGLSKLEQQPTNRYFKRKKLEDIVMLHGMCSTKRERDQLGLFVHFLKGVLDPDPWKRWTAHQASMHPFLTGAPHRNRTSLDGRVDGVRSGGKPYDIYWVPPWDPSICRRKLLHVQKSREKAQGVGRRRYSDSARQNSQQLVPVTSSTSNPPPHSFHGVDVPVYGSPLKSSKKMEPPSPSLSVTSQVAAMADAMSLGRQPPISGNMSPPQTLDGLVNVMQQQYPNIYPQYTNVSTSLGAVAVPLTYQQLAGAGLNHTQSTGRSYNENAYPAPAALPQALQSSLHGLNEFVYSQQPPISQPFMGAQSYSGGYYDRAANQNVNAESELGYALQRPGVVPGMGSDAAAAVALQRQTSNSQLAYLAQQSPMMGNSSWGNLSTTPRSYGPIPGARNYASAAPKSPGGLLSAFQKQEQMLDKQSDINYDAGGGLMTSLLAQQLAEYSDSNQHLSGPNNLPVHTACNNISMSQNGQPDKQQLQIQNPGIIYGSGGPVNPSSHHSGFVSYSASSGAPPSMQYIDTRFNSQPVGLGSAYLPSGSYGEYGTQLPQQLRMNTNHFPNVAIEGQNQRFSNISDQDVQNGSEQATRPYGYSRSTTK